MQEKFIFCGKTKGGFLAKEPLIKLISFPGLDGAVRTSERFKLKYLFQTTQNR